MKIPTIEEVAKYCRERGNNIDAEHFCAYYEQRDWKIPAGRVQKKMKSWKLAVITWEKNSARFGNPAPDRPTHPSQKPFKREQETPRADDDVALANLSGMRKLL